MSQPVPVPGRDKIIPNKPKAHNNRKEKQRNEKEEKQPTEKEDRNRKGRTTKKEQKEKRTRTGKERDSQIFNLSKIGSNFGNSSYVESVIVKNGILKINNRGTKTMEPLNKIKQLSPSVKASNKNGKGGKVG